ncbi:hypothetical protein Y032_0148g2655 [Ancylostoma ceylanicum]|uniref:Secreted protein n=1 Tax=Ancylostoma ceylanicum TaxID=53326 RepID=A0A016T1V3_9BILA|nr:hypothetical protein Y032_0148g2655 [Ancylostoma ceylanicum]
MPFLSNVLNIRVVLAFCTLHVLTPEMPSSTAVHRRYFMTSIQELQSRVANIVISENVAFHGDERGELLCL